MSFVSFELLNKTLFKNGIKTVINSSLMRSVSISYLSSKVLFTSWNETKNVIIIRLVNYTIIIRIIMSFQLYFTLPNEGSFGANNVLNFIFWTVALLTEFLKFIELIGLRMILWESLFFIRTQAHLIYLSFPRFNSSTNPYFHLIRGVFSETKTISPTQIMSLSRWFLF